MSARHCLAACLLSACAGVMGGFVLTVTLMEVAPAHSYTISEAAGGAVSDVRAAQRRQYRKIPECDKPLWERVKDGCPDGDT